MTVRVMATTYLPEGSDKQELNYNYYKYKSQMSQDESPDSLKLALALAWGRGRDGDRGGPPLPPPILEGHGQVETEMSSSLLRPIRFTNELSSHGDQISITSLEDILTLLGVREQADSLEEGGRLIEGVLDGSGKVDLVARDNRDLCGVRNSSQRKETF